jgi:hypothetical protein
MALIDCLIVACTVLVQLLTQLSHALRFAYVYLQINVGNKMRNNVSTAALCAVSSCVVM